MPLGSPEKRRERKDAAREIGQKVADVVERYLETDPPPEKEDMVGRVFSVGCDGGAYDVTLEMRFKRLT